MIRRTIKTLILALAFSLLNLIFSLSVIVHILNFGFISNSDAYPVNVKLKVQNTLYNITVTNFKFYNAGQTQLQQGEQRQGHRHRQKRSGLIDDEIKSTIECEPLDAPKNDKGESKMTICKKRLSWQDAHKACEDTVGHLATLVSRADAEQLVDSIFAKSFFDDEYDWGRKTHIWGLDRRYWIGLTDMMEEGKWAWVGKGQTLTYRTMWYPHQPDHVDQQGKPIGNRRQHCVSLWNPAYYKVDDKGKAFERHTFDDLECEKELYFICEKDPNKP